MFQTRECVQHLSSFRNRSRGDQRDQWAAMSPPRLTGALRSFSIVSRKEELSEKHFDLKVSSSPVPRACPAQIDEVITPRQLWIRHLWPAGERAVLN